MRKKSGNRNERGFTIIETVLSIAIFAMMALALLNMFDAILRSVRSNKAMLAANSIALEQIEIIRGMDFEKVATDTGWVPAGPLLSQKTVSRDGISYLVETDVSWFDDPYDGTESDSEHPDTFPMDYKKARVRISWNDPTSGYGERVSMSTNIVPAGLEGLSDGKGGIYVSAFDALGAPIALASVSIDNASLGYNLSGVQTDLNGNLWVPDLNPGSNYHIKVTKAGYSTSETYAVNNDPASPDYNPVPSKSHAIVIAGSVSKLGFSIDLLGSMNIKTVHFNNPANLRANVGTAAEQTGVASVLSPPGQIFAAWADTRSGESNIYMQKFSYNSGSGTYERSWGSDALVVNRPGCSSPELEISPDGSLYLVWSDTRNVHSDIYLQKISTSNGNLMGLEYMVNHDAFGGLQTNPDIDSDQDGNLYIVWEDNREGTWDIFAQKFSLSTGSFWGSDLKACDSDYAEQLNAKILSDREEAGGSNASNLYIVWQSNHSGNFNIYWRKLDRNGNEILPERQINSDGGSLDQYTPDIAFDGTGYFYAVWADERNSQPDIYLQKLDKSGNLQLGGDVKINDDSFAAARRIKPSVGYASDSAIYISWEDNRNGNTAYNIYASKINSSAVRQWTYDMILADTLNSFQTDSVTLADGYGKAMTFWQDNRNGTDNDIFGAYYQEMGNVQRSGISIRVISEKTRGSYPNPLGGEPAFLPIPKYETVFTSDMNGNIRIGSTEGGLEWGGYTFAAESPYDITSIDLPSPISVAPDGEANVVINVSP